MRIEPYLAPRPANFRPLSPADLLVRAVESHGSRTAVVWRDRTWSYREFGAVAARFVRWLQVNGVLAGDVVSVMSVNRPEMLAAHYAIPAIGAVLNTINTRLDADTVAYILDHAESRIILADPTCAAIAGEAARQAGVRLVVFSDGDGPDALDLLGADDDDAPFAVTGVTDEWQPLCVNYTSGTTGRPKGVVYHHRGGYLNAIGNVTALGFTRHTVYLWTLPMFHCNGWCHTWAVTAAGGVHVCLERIDPADIFAAIEANGVTHFACAPVVLYMLLNHPARRPKDLGGRRVLVGTGGAAPTATLIEQLDAIGIDIVHLYGLTESYGPVTLCTLPDDMAEASPTQKATWLARQGVSHATANTVRVADEAGRDTPADGASIGEVLLAGSTLMAGYWRDADATETAFAGGWFHTGDLAVRHPDGSIELKDRAKDIIISGGENISSIEVEGVLHRHPSVMLAAVVAAPDEKWGEVPCAFVELKAGAEGDAEGLRNFCRQHLAGFKVPRRFVFRDLPKTATGKIQKFALRQEAAKTSTRPQQ